MRKIIIVSVLLSGILLFCTCYDRQSSFEVSVQVEKLYKKQLDSFVQSTAAFNELVKSEKNKSILQQAFISLRKKYKAVEVFAEYYNPSVAKAINGPAVFDAEPDNPEYPVPPSGLQVVETFLFDTAEYKPDELIKETASLQAAVARLKMVSETLQFTDAHIFDAIRLQLFRIVTLGISGYDTPLCLSAISEIPATLTALHLYMVPYKSYYPQINFDSLDTHFAATAAFAENSSDFNHFNRSVFLTVFFNPLCRELSKIQDYTGITYFNEPRLLRSNAVTLFDEKAFNPYFNTPPGSDTFNAQMVALGKLLFNEKKLSANEIRSCSSCHIEEKAFTDGLAKNKTFAGKEVILRNTPSILYASLQPSLFADSRLSYLEDQAKQVIENPDEMHGDMRKAAVILEKDPLYKTLFYKTFKSTQVSSLQIQQAIAAYIRTKNTFDSRFDQYMRGNTSALSADEQKGFNIFMGKGKCGACHFIPLFNGTIPPAYNETESEVLAVPEKNNLPYVIDADMGKYNFIHATPYAHAFKTPGLRNVLLTAPYMHNGVYKTIEEVTDFYNKGGGAGLGIMGNQTLSAEKLNLTEKEKEQLKAFLQSLNDNNL